MRILLKICVVWFLLIQAFEIKADFNSALDAYEAKDYKSAFEEFSRLAEIGEKRSQFNLGIMYFQGQFVKKDIYKAYAWTKLATENESSSEQERNIHKMIAGKIEDSALAEAEFRSLESNYADEVLLERLYPVLIEKSQLASFDAKPIKTVNPKFPMSAARKGIQGYVSLKLDLDKLGNPRNIRVVEAYPLNVFEAPSLKAVQKWRFEPAKDKDGMPIESFDFSYKMEYSIGQSKLGVDEEQYRKTRIEADEGNLKAQLTIGFWHKRFNDLPGEENPVEWLLKAAKQGSPLAQYEVGESLLNGKGCFSDRTKGIEWLTRAAADGQTDAMNLLAGLATSDSSLEAQKQAVSFISKLDELSASATIRLSWLLSTSPYQEIADPKRALSLLDDIKWQAYRDDVTKQQIQAAAFAALGKFDKAVDYQEDALDDAEDLGFDVAELKAQLAMYQQKKKWF